MCGRFVLMDDSDIAEINKIMTDISAKYKDSGLTAKTGEVYPTNNAAILALQNGKPSLSLMQWGFPKWDNKGIIINAKSETAAEKRMFAKPLAEHRCVVPSTGFFEWAKRDGKTKTKYRFNDKNGLMLYMAGFYTNYNDHEEDKLIKDRFVILTRSANDSISDIHERMPVILYKHELVHWLTDSDFASFVLRRNDVELIREAV